MAAPTFGSLTYTSPGGADANSISVTPPTGVAAGDIVLIHLHRESSSYAVPTCTDATRGDFAVAPGALTSGGQNLTVLWKRANGADSTGTPYVVNWTGTVAYRVAYSSRYPGCVASGTPYEGGTSAGGSGTTTPAVSMTTTGVDRLLVLGLSNFDTTTYGTATSTGATWTKQNTLNNNMGLETSPKAVAAATGNITATSSASVAHVAHVLALLPLSGAAHTRTVTDPIGITDSSTRAAGKARTVTDPVGVTDASSRAAAKARTVTDAVGVTDSRTQVKSGPQFLDLAIGDITVEGAAPIAADHSVPVGIGDIRVEGTDADLAGTTLNDGQITVQGLPIQVSYGSSGVPGLGGVVNVPPSNTTRFIAQSILTGEFLSWDLEISDPTITLALSGPSSITGKLDPEQPQVQELLRSGKFQPWACWIHQEVDGFIRASGILQPYVVDGESLSVEAAGVSAYLHGIPWLAELSAIQVDPADVVRAIWAHVQSFPDGHLGVTVTGTTPVRIGEPAGTAPKVDGNGNPVLDDSGHQILEPVAAKPYELMWWEGTDCGSEMDALAKEAPFDFVERCAWNAAKTGVVHWIELAYPRIGVRQTGLRFASGENVTGAVPAEETDGLYASQVVTFGSGEGRDTIRGYAGRPMPGRLRRVAIVQDGTISTSDRATAVACDDLERRQGLVDVTDLEVDARHVNARFGSYSVGDDILIDVEVGWLGRLRQWERILSITYAPDGESVRLQLRRADAFRTGGL